MLPGSTDRALLFDRPAQSADAERLLRFGDHYREIARPFEWNFTRENLDRLLTKIDAHQIQPALAA